jgi:uncharacterized protein YchJ
MKKIGIIGHSQDKLSSLIDNTLKFDLHDVVVSENTESLKYFDEEEVFKISEMTKHFPIIDRVEQYFREKPKVGRNETCPCGSDKKYKKCCK